MKQRVVAIALLSLMLNGCSLNFFGNEHTQEELSQAQREARDKLTRGKTSRPSLASLQLEPARDDLPSAQASTTTQQATRIPKLSLEQKRDEYLALLPLIEDAELKQQVAFRLADIQMLLAEQALEQGDDQQAQAFATAIDSYQRVIDQVSVVVPMPGKQLTDEQQIDNIKLMDAMYQLSRAYDLSGQRALSVTAAEDFLSTFTLTHFAPTVQHIELWFRIGEHYFAQNNYASAIAYYEQVLLHGRTFTQNDFYSISAYMLGWSHFKLDDYDNALVGFDKMLAHSLQTIGGVDTMQVQDLPVSKGNLRLIQDSLRVMALTFSYRGNAQAIQRFYTDNAEHDGAEISYMHLLYEELAQQHLDDDRYQDSADVLIAFAQKYPVHPRSVEFFVRHIDAFILGDFSDKVLLGKQAFVAQYGLGNGVVKSLSSPIGEQVSVYLQQYLPELAQTEHSIAQATGKMLDARQNNQQSAEFAQGFVSEQASEAQANYWRTIDTQSLQSLHDEALDNAINYYAAYIHSFADDQALAATVAELRFYMAEALLSAQRFAEAIAAFETYAYQDQVNPMAVEAAYAAILAWDSLPQQSNLSENQIYSTFQQSQARFLTTFGNDRRSPAIAVNLMQALFKQSQFEPAMQWADWILVQMASIHTFSDQQRESALLVTAHGHFELQQYAEAEQYYARVLTDLTKDDSRHEELTEALAASIYKQAEVALLAQGLTQQTLATFDLSASTLDKLQSEALYTAIGHFTRLLTTTPNASTRIVAEYDIATYHAMLGNWQQAIAGWLTFAQRYPAHELSANIQPQLLFAYEQTQDWPAAAQILLSKYEQDQTSENGRLALYTAAEYFDKADQRDLALDTYRRYAHAFEQPLGPANEARYRLSQFYEESAEQSKRRFWLNKMMQAQLALSASQPATVGTPRSRYLAAMSAMVFAQDARIAFERIKLNVPLDKSLRQKQQALQRAIDAFDRVMSFAVAEYTTAANYQLGTLYSRLAMDLMDSERPQGLSLLELEQYDILLEEQAYPFEETAIQIHEQNIARVQTGLYDDYVRQSFEALSKSMPARYNKPEITAQVTIDEL